LIEVIVSVRDHILSLSDATAPGDPNWGDDLNPHHTLPAFVLTTVEIGGEDRAGEGLTLIRGRFLLARLARENRVGQAMADLTRVLAQLPVGARVPVRAVSATPQGYRADGAELGRLTITRWLRLGLRRERGSPDAVAAQAEIELTGLLPPGGYGDGT